MSFVTAAPELVTSAAQDLAAIRSTLSEASAAAASPTTAVLAPAADEVSIALAGLFGDFGQEYQAISAQAQAFHAQFVDLLSAGANSYIGAEAANAAQIVQNAASAPASALLGQSSVGAAASSSGISGLGGAIARPYESLIANTTANLQGISNTWANSTTPALLQALTTQTGYPQTIVRSLESGNLLPLLGLPGQITQSYATLVKDLTVPISLSLTALSPSTATLALGLGLPQVLAFDALGAPVNAATAFAASSTSFANAVLAGNPLAAAIAVADAPANIANAFLNGQETLTLSLPLAGASVTANVPFSGLLVPLQPLAATGSFPGSPILSSVTITGPPVGGLIPALVEYAPELIADAFVT
jgi:hypothetical protein